MAETEAFALTDNEGVQVILLDEATDPRPLMVAALLNARFDEAEIPAVARADDWLPTINLLWLASTPRKRRVADSVNRISESMSGISPAVPAIASDDARCIASDDAIEEGMGWTRRRLILTIEGPANHSPVSRRPGSTVAIS